MRKYEHQEKSPATVAAIERHGSIAALVRVSGVPRCRIEVLDEDELTALSMSFPANQVAITKEERAAAIESLKESGKSLWDVSRELGYLSQTKYQSLYVALNHNRYHSRHSIKLFKYLANLTASRNEENLETDTDGSIGDIGT